MPLACPDFLSAEVAEKIHAEDTENAQQIYGNWIDHRSLFIDHRLLPIVCPDFLSAEITEEIPTEDTENAQ